MRQEDRQAINEIRDMIKFWLKKMRDLQIL